MTCEQVFRLLCQLISGSMRLILFFASILFMIVSIILLILSGQNQSVYKLIEVTKSDSYFYILIALAIYLVVLSIFGIYGSFFKDEGIIKWFALLASLNILIGCGVYMFISPRLVDSYSELEHKLQGSLEKYDWFHSRDSSAEIKNATEKWDEIQATYQCCGVHSFNDWTPFKPISSRDLYPRSCCNMTTTTIAGQVVSEQQEICDNKRAHTVGCVDGIEMVNAAIAQLLTALVIMNLVLGAMASIVVFCQPDPSYERY